MGVDAFMNVLFCFKYMHIMETCLFWLFFSCLVLNVLLCYVLNMYTTNALMMMVMIMTTKLICLNVNCSTCYAFCLLKTADLVYLT